MQSMPLKSDNSNIATLSPRRRISTLPALKLRRIKEFMEINLSMDLGIKTIARASGYSQTHFLRMFRASTGATPHQYLIERRVRRAQKLLCEGAAKLTDIAALCGFSSQSHLATVFRKQVGMTPTEYRRAALVGQREAFVSGNGWNSSAVAQSWNRELSISAHSPGAL
jgi:AraC-like DNA-binding protein